MKGTIEANTTVSFSLIKKHFFRVYLTKAELLALTPQDIDFDNKVIRITKSYQRLEGKDVITDPKTPKSKRNVSMPDFLCEELKEYIGRLYGFLPTDRIFHLTKSFLHHEMTRGAGKAGVKRIRIHDLRHPYVKPTTKNMKTAIANIFLYAYNCCSYPHGNSTNEANTKSLRLNCTDDLLKFLVNYLFCNEAFCLAGFFISSHCNKKGNNILLGFF